MIHSTRTPSRKTLPLLAVVGIIFLKLFFPSKDSFVRYKRFPQIAKFSSNNDGEVTKRRVSGQTIFFKYSIPVTTGIQ